MATLMVAVAGPSAVAAMQRSLQAAQGRALQRDFDQATAALSNVVRALWAQRDEWSHAVVAGDVYDDETSAQAAAADEWAELSSRYGGEGGGGADHDPMIVRAVITLTLVYVGEEPAIEHDMLGRSDVEAALLAVQALTASDRLRAVQLHISPSSPDDRLTDEQLLASFPELSPL
jgi:hypothetical protein